MLIFNADDYGLTKIDSQRVLELSVGSVIRSTTIASNFVDKTAINGIKSTDLSTGIHLNLVEGKPLYASDSLRGDDGYFLPKHDFLKKVMLGKINSDELEKEIAAQFENLLDQGVSITHIDSHQNIHLVLPVLNKIVTVAKRYNVRKIRGQSSEYSWFMRGSKTKILFKSVFSGIWNLTAQDYFKFTQKIIINAPGLGLSIKSIDRAVNMWRDALSQHYDKNIVYEVPCHLYLSDFEYELYKSKSFSAMLKQLKIKIGNYDEF